MIIGSILENQNIEKRIAVTPDIVKKYISLGFDIVLSENYGSHLGFADKEYVDLGAKISRDDNEILNSSDIILQIGMLSEDKCLSIKENQTLVGTLNPYINKEKIDNLVKKNKCFFFRTFAKNNTGSIYGYTVFPSKSCRI